MRTTPTSPNFHTNGRTLSLDRFNVYQPSLHGGSPVAQGALPFFALPLPSTQIESLSKQILSSETKKKSHGAKSGEYGACSSTGVRLSAKYRSTDKALWAGALSWCKIHG
ncbi:hypothetical protein TNCV_1840721 [Trichonephila clavipes]|nr:hypothetical protein TNCV_1840721 [Trichonephila clavipes]